MDGPSLFAAIGKYISEKERIEITARDNFQDNFFEKLYFEFPVPFKKGDLVYLPEYLLDGDISDPVVISKVFRISNCLSEATESADSSDSAKLSHSLNSSDGDIFDTSSYAFKKYLFDNFTTSNDMYVTGYRLCDDGNLSGHEALGNYMDIEFYNKPLSDSYRILKSMSEYLKEEIDLSQLLACYRNFILENT